MFHDILRYNKKASKHLFVCMHISKRSLVPFATSLPYATLLRAFVALPISYKACHIYVDEHNFFLRSFSCYTMQNVIMLEDVFKLLQVLFIECMQ